MSRLTKRVRSDISPMILKLLNLEEAPEECIEVIGTDSKTCDEVCEENQCKSCVLSAVFEKLAHYEDLEEQGRLAEIVRCKDCEWFKPNQAQGKDLGVCIIHGGVYREMDFCNAGKLAELKGTEE